MPPLRRLYTPAGVNLAPSGAPSVAAGPLSRVAGNVGTGVRGGVGGCVWTGGPSDRRVRRKQQQRASDPQPCPGILHCQAPLNAPIASPAMVVGCFSSRPPFVEIAPIANGNRDAIGCGGRAGGGGGAVGNGGTGGGDVGEGAIGGTDGGGGDGRSEMGGFSGGGEQGYRPEACTLSCLRVPRRSRRQTPRSWPAYLMQRK